MEPDLHYGHWSKSIVPTPCPLFPLLLPNFNYGLLLSSFKLIQTTAGALFNTLFVKNIVITIITAINICHYNYCYHKYFGLLLWLSDCVLLLQEISNVLSNDKPLWMQWAVRLVCVCVCALVPMLHFSFSLISTPPTNPLGYLSMLGDKNDTIAPPQVHKWCLPHSSFAELVGESTLILQRKRNRWDCGCFTHKLAFIFLFCHLLSALSILLLSTT